MNAAANTEQDTNTNTNTDSTDNAAENNPDAPPYDARTEPGYISPLDAAFKRGNPRPDFGGLSFWDPEALTIPALSLAPGNITGLQEYDAEMDAGLVAPAVDALAAMHDTSIKVITAREAARADVTMTEAAKLIAVDDLHGRLWSVPARKVDAALATLGKQIAHFEAALHAPLQATSSTHLASEIRAHVRGLTLGERQSLLTEAINEGDAVTAGAVLGAVPYLSGLTNELQSAFTHQWNVARQPDTARKLALLRKVHEKVQIAGGAFIGSFDKLIGAPQAKVQQIRAQQARTRKAIGG